MSNLRIVFEITKWEFSRWFKLKDQLVTLVVSCGMGFLVWGGTALLNRSDQDPVTLPVLNSHLLPFTRPEGSRLVFKPVSADSEQILREAVGRREFDGLLILSSIDTADLVVSRQPVWKHELEQILTQARLQSKIRSMGVTPDQVADAFRPFSVNVVFHENAKRPAGTGEKIAAGIIIGLMLLGVFVSFAYQFVTITGEKQLRVTEQIISAVSPQQWVDGKILGLSAFAFLSTMTYVVSILIFVGISGLFGKGLEIPVEVTNPLIIVALVLLGAAGYLFWNTFFAALAATINDPNTSARGSMILLPVTATVLAGLLALKNPDSLITQVLAVFPPTAPAALSARLVLTETSTWEVLAAYLLLLVSIWLMRTVAGKVFHLGVLMYGKEPSFKELVRWIRET
ncbi:MAG: hypothetical protein HW389_3010 [Bacteroidetes bacterium]|nr:hypothetical protein [Bacteroidota bacterium]